MQPDSNLYYQANIGKHLQCLTGSVMMEWCPSLRFLPQAPDIWANIYQHIFPTFTHAHLGLFEINQCHYSQTSTCTQLLLFPDVEGEGYFTESLVSPEPAQLFFLFWWHSASSCSSLLPAAVSLLLGWIRTAHSCLVTGPD